jgi:hypothetical protein
MCLVILSDCLGNELNCGIGIDSQSARPEASARPRKKMRAARPDRASVPCAPPAAVLHADKITQSASSLRAAISDALR